MQKQSVIICGSKKTNIDLSDIVDKFDIIIRHNKSLPKSGYGNRDSTLQILNKHVYENYKQGLNAEQLYKYYRHMNVSMEHLVKYCDYIYRLDPSKVISYERNNQQLMEQIAIAHNLDVSDAIISMHKDRFNNDQLHIRCGLSHIAKCVSIGIKPWTVGYSLQESEISDHNYNTKSVTGAHNIQLEIRLLKELHDRRLIDASLCNISTDGSMRQLVKPTDEAKKIINVNLCRH